MTGRAPSLTGNTLATVNGLSPLQAALRYAALGLPVFPVAPVNRVTGQCGCKEGAACEAVGTRPALTRSKSEVGGRGSPRPTSACRPGSALGWWLWMWTASMTGSRPAEASR
jgi:hypothetical protein